MPAVVTLCSPRVERLIIVIVYEVEPRGFDRVLIRSITRGRGLCKCGTHDCKSRQGDQSSGYFREPSPDNSNMA
jgi:hypothetical protein